MTCALNQPPSLRTSGTISADVDHYAKRRLNGLTHDAPGIVGAVSLELQAGEGLEPATFAKLRVEVGDHVARAHAIGATATEAIDRAMSRMQRHFLTMRDRPWATPSPPRDDRSWEFGDHAGNRPPFATRPAEERTLVRHKTYDRVPRTPDSAIMAAALLDYDFYLFVDAGTHRAAVVCRRDTRKWHLADAARCGIDEAIELLDVSNARFMFFIDDASNTLHALYRRYDGNYGVISPESSPEPSPER
jgi:hypothetical protein